MLSPGSRINEPEVNPRLVDMPSLVIEIAVTIPPLTTMRTLTPNALVHVKGLAPAAIENGGRSAGEACCQLLLNSWTARLTLLMGAYSIESFCTITIEAEHLKPWGIANLFSLAYIGDPALNRVSDTFSLLPPPLIWSMVKNCNVFSPQQAHLGIPL